MNELSQNARALRLDITITDILMLPGTSRSRLRDSRSSLL